MSSKRINYKTALLLTICSCMLNGLHLSRPLSSEELQMHLTTLKKLSVDPAHKDFDTMLSEKSKFQFELASDFKNAQILYNLAYQTG